MNASPCHRQRLTKAVRGTAAIFHAQQAKTERRHLRWIFNIEGAESGMIRMGIRQRIAETLFPSTILPPQSYSPVGARVII